MHKKTTPSPVKLIRRLLPALHSRNMLISAEGQLKRSWPVAPGEFLRLYSDEPLILEVELNLEMAAPKAVLHTNLLSPEGSWEEIAFHRQSSRRFTLSLQPMRCGIFQFKLKYSPDNGASWFWDRTPYTKVIVDPAGARDVRLYTLIPSASGHVGDWKNELSRVRDMGFNIVHLLPVTRLDASKSPYSAADLFDMDPAFMDPADSRKSLDQFEDFVLEAKNKGLGLCIDLVLNHIGINSRMAQSTPEWLVPDKNEANGLLRAGCWHMNRWIKWADLVRIYYDHPEPAVQKDIWKYMTSYALFWANYAAFTGGMVRLDNLHSSHPGFITSLLTEIRAAYPALIIQAEFFSDSNTLLKAAAESELNLFLANPWEYPFAENLREYLLYLHGISSKLRFLTTVSTHDTGAPAQLYGAPEAVVPRYFITALMTTGQTGMVQGAEHGVLQKIEFIGRTRKEPFETPDRFNVPIRKINEIHRAFGLFHRGGNIAFVDNGHGAVIAALREDAAGNGERFLLMANLDIENSHVLSLSAAAWKRAGAGLVLHELIDNRRTHVNGDFLQVELPPSGVRAYRFEYR
ncbi:MAG: alpha-amylase family glycosyl hydrolase [Fibrobacterota bacterium]